MKKNIVRFTAKFMICVLTYQLVVPATRLFALTSGPSQPEVQSFEPVGTTEMVDMFSGDFVYNIPLLDIEGYPINIAYHSGINMEQEASWVGLGWNINPGEINRGVRGVPDDFNGDTVSKFLNIKPETDFKLQVGAGIELFGSGPAGLNISAGQYITYNNYRGMGVGTDISAQLTTPVVTTGVGVSVGSLEGASVDANIGASFSTSMTETANSGSISLSAGTGFNTRTGLKDIGYNINMGIANANNGGQSFKTGFGSSIPVGLQNYVSVVTNASNLTAFSFQVKLGIEAMWTFPNFNTMVSWSKLSYEPDGSLPAYGYLNAQNATDKSIMDFSREKDGVYNSSLPNLPMSSMTYDVYNVSGQGTGGMFRPFRSDVGSVYDPLVSSSSSNNNFNLEVGIGIGPVGGLFELGTDVTVFRSRVESGPWFLKKFQANKPRSLFENAYFKQGGEMTYSVQQDASNLASGAPVYASADGQLKNSSNTSIGALPGTYSETENRSARANNLSFVTNAETATPRSRFSSRRNDYPVQGFTGAADSVKKRFRSGVTVNKARGHHIAEVTQTLPDGRRYVYGLPAMNNLQKEASFSVDNNRKNLSTGLVKFTAGTEDSRSNTTGRENFFQAVYTPAYAHSYLLTQVLSPDYADISGDGPTEDDLGTYTRFNYSQVDSDYRWVAPIEAREGSDSAQYNPGFWSDLRDDKGNYVMGSKEMWYMHSIESKNFIAEFYISPRQDGKGITKAVATDYSSSANVDAFLKANKSGASLSYKLDSIKLFNKHDRFTNLANATPIKTVIFNYDYSLCPGVPNRDAPGSLGNGKLTLKRIYFRYGKSDKSLLNPYVFGYDMTKNPPYRFANKDRWGNYKVSNDTFSNYEFPYVKQAKYEAGDNARSWHMNQIKLPSGGKLWINYESDDYSYVQDKRTMEMFRIAGVGTSSSFQPKDVLYDDIDHPCDYIYFTRDQSREVPGRSMRENYLENTDLLYFSFNVDIAARNRYEYIRGYAKVEDVGICDSPNYGYIKVKRESAGGNSGAMLNPVTLAGLNTGRYYLPHIVYPGYNDNDPGNAAEIMRGMIAATSELFSLFQNANVRFVQNSLSKKIRVSNSCIRLHTPGYTKLGGGARVQMLQLADSWDQMAPNGAMATYGNTYNYTMLKGDGTRISSGVASYEPMIGGDENPLRRPVDYTASSGKLLPAIEFYQEEPFGESFYPSPTVGYSKVTVQSINKNNGRSGKSEDVYEFYTAKDFPVRTEYTAKNTPVDTKQRTLVSRNEDLQVLQGYVIRLNDMHGKPKAVSSYMLKADNVSKELVTATRYNYQTDQQGRLDNTVKAVKRDHLVKPTYSITDMKLGEEVDFTIDSRRRETESSSLKVAFNLNVVNFLFVTIPIPTVFFPDVSAHSRFQTMVSTKVIQQYGVLKSVEVNDHGALTKTENVLYDSETGNVLLTKVNNEFNDPVNNLSYPAYWAYDNMGPAYYNTGYEDRVDSAYVDNCNRAHLVGIANKRHFNPGDELMMQYTVNNVQSFQRVYVYGTGFYGNSDSYCGGPQGTAIDPCTIVVEPDSKTPGGYPTFIWHMGGTILHNVGVKVIRSGRRNQLNANVQELVINGSFPVSTFSQLFNAPQFGIGGTGQSNLVSATATTYKEEGVNNEFTSGGLGGSFALTPYLTGEKGNWRPWASYTWKGDRNYASNHARKDGTFNTYSPFWQLGTAPVDAGSCSMLDYIMQVTGNPGWQKLKEVTAYNAYGQIVEEADAAGIPSAALYGNNYTLPLAVAGNARREQVKFLGFEDLMQIQHANKLKYGIWPTMRFNGPIQDITSYVYRFGQKYWKPAGADFVTNAVVTNLLSHSGNYCLLMGTNSKVRIASMADFAGVPYCFVSFWVFTPNGGTPDVSQIQIQATGKDANGNPTSNTWNAFAVTTGNINNWYKVEGKIQMSLMNAYTDIHIKMPVNYAIDDIRMMPDNANMKSFVYDVLTHRLMAELDENNFATFYEYDAEGALVRVKKESDRGILTVNENRKSNAKKVQ